jgi:hypothetical protein
MSSQMANYPDLLLQLANALPDTPRLIETRGMLLANACEVLGLKQTNDLNFVVRSFQTGLISVIGKPSTDSIRRATQQNKNQYAVLAFEDNLSYVSEALSSRKVDRAILHLRNESIRLPNVETKMVRYISKEEIAAHSGIPDELKTVLLIASRNSRVAATIVDHQPVSFCYAGSETETLWDISIDTLEGYRGKGYAVMAVSFLIREMKTLGKQPVWGAIESNRASMRLAKKLFFEPVDSLFVFEQKCEKS